MKTNTKALNLKKTLAFVTSANAPRASTPSCGRIRRMLSIGRELEVRV